MEPKIINFTVDNQMLVNQTGSICLASGTVEYVGAHFELGENWSGFDSIISAWANFRTVKTAVLDPDGSCQVPTEVLAQKGTVLVNLVGSKVENDVVVERLTTCKIEAATIGCDANLSGSETVPVTPSQFEQFVAIVIAEVEKVTGMTAQAETLPPGSDAYARYEDGVLYLGIPEGAQGEAGADGADGNGISSITLNADYTLTISYTDGTSTTVGPIRGAEGPEGPRGPQGEPGQDGVTPVFSIGNVETLPAGSDAEASITGTPEAPVLNLRIPKGDPGEVTMETLEQILPTDTASGAIASFPDGSDLFPAKSVLVDIDPVQDLNGYNSPWPPGGGKNKVYLPPYSTDDYHIFARMLNPSVDVSAQSITLTCAGSGQSVIELKHPYPSGDWALSFDVSVYDPRFVICAYDANDNVLTNSDYSIAGLTWNSFYKGYFGNGNSKTFTVPNNVDHFCICVGVVEDVVNTSATISRIQLESGTAVTSYAPYSNICPINGWTEAKVQRTGKNLIDSSVIVQGNWDNEGSVYQTNVVTHGYLPIKGGQTYMWSASASVAGRYIRFYDENKNYDSSGSISQYDATNRTFTAPPWAHYMRILWYSGNGITADYIKSLNSQIELGSTATPYEPYQGETYDVTWQNEAGTVYGGTVDIVSGKLTATKAIAKAKRSDFGGISQAPSSGMPYREVALLLPPTASKTNWALARQQQISNMVTIANPYSETAYGNFIGVVFTFSYASDGLTMRVSEDVYQTLGADDYVEICYELEEPVEYQLTEQEVEILLGQNNIWANTGDTSVTYKADIQRYIEKKLA